MKYSGKPVCAALISIVGPPASGKTTVARWLCGQLHAELVREDYAGNPFLADFYLGRADLALSAQLYFLFSRLSQLSFAALSGAGTVVSDYGFCQDAAYAAGNLSLGDLAVYRRLAAQAEGMVKPPDVLIHLDAGEQLLLDRIARRGRRHETAFTARFIGRMRKAYGKVVATIGCPVIPVNVDRVDLLAEPARAELLRKVREALETLP